MWRLYANDAKGICIGFKKDLTILNATEKNFQLPTVCTMKYGESDLKKIISDLFPIINELLTLSNFQKSNEIQRQEIIQNFITHALTQISIANIQTKNSSFSHEKECRFTLIEGKLLNNGDGFFFPASQKRFITTTNSCNIELDKKNYLKRLTKKNHTLNLKNLKQVILKSFTSDQGY